MHVPEEELGLLNVGEKQVLDLQPFILTRIILYRDKDCFLDEVVIGRWHVGKDLRTCLLKLRECTSHPINNASYLSLCSKHARSKCDRRLVSGHFGESRHLVERSDSTCLELDLARVWGISHVSEALGGGRCDTVGEIVTDFLHNLT